MAPPTFEEFLRKKLRDVGTDFSPDELEQFRRTGQISVVHHLLLSRIGPESAPDMDKISRSKRQQDVREELELELQRMSTPSPGYGYAYAAYPHTSSAPSPGCKDHCKTCSLSFLCGHKSALWPYVACLEDLTAQAELDDLASSTLRNLEEVRIELDKFGNTILRRW